MLVADGPRFEVDVGGGVELGNDNVDVVASHSGTQCGETLSVIRSGQGMEFAVGAFEFDVVEDVFEHVDSVGIANKEDVVGQIVACHINVVKAPVGSQYQFA